MRNMSDRIVAGLALTMGAALVGCGGSGDGAKPNAQIRAVDVGTNLVYNNTDTGTVLINGGASFEQVTYGTPSHYQYIQAQSSSLQAYTTLPEPYMIYPPGTDNNNTTNVSVVVPPPTSTFNPANGANYTAYLVGRPDVPDPSNYAIPPAADPTGLDPRYMSVVALQDNQAAPAAGDATVRVLNAVCDVTLGPTASQVYPLPTLNVTITGAGNNATYSNIPFATQATGASPDQSLTGGTVTVTATATYTTTSNGVSTQHTVTLPLSPNTASIPAGGKYTLVITEPTDITVDAISPTGTSQVTYGVQVIKD